MTFVSSCKKATKGIMLVITRALLLKLNIEINQIFILAWSELEKPLYFRGDDLKSLSTIYHALSGR